MKTVDARTGVEWLEREECLRLLAGDEVGRLAVDDWHTPVIFRSTTASTARRSCSAPTRAPS